MDIDHPDHKRLDRYFAAGAAVVILGLLARFAGDGLRADFTPDDMMNLYGAWFRPILQADRPFGALLYRGLFAAFGLNPLPYRVVCAALLLLNLGLLFRFCWKVTASRAVAALACLLGAYHAYLADLYYSTGTVYDLLCGACYLAAFLVYVRIRREGGFDWPRAALFLVLYLLALQAKEMAVTLPPVLLAYDLIYRTPGRGWAAAREWVIREARILGPAVAIAAAFILYKAVGPGRMIDNPDYRLHLHWTAFLEAWRHYAFDLFYGRLRLDGWRIVRLWAVLVAIAAVARRRELWFALCFLAIGIQPVAFITPRSFFAIYLTLPGWYLFAAAAIGALIDAVAGRFDGPARGWARWGAHVAVFVIVAAMLYPAHRRNKPRAMGWVGPAHAAVRSVLGHMGDAGGGLPRGARVLFVSDPYPKDEWMLTFIFRLYYRDDTMRVDRMAALRERPDAAALASYDRLLATDGRTMWVVARQ